MPYMGMSISPSEEPACMRDADQICSICRETSETECDCCGCEICWECIVKCAGCLAESSGDYCLSCAVRKGYAEINSKHWCENCQPESESEMEMLRR